MKISRIAKLEAQLTEHLAVKSHEGYYYLIDARNRLLMYPEDTLHFNGETRIVRDLVLQLAADLVDTDAQIAAAKFASQPKEETPTQILLSITRNNDFEIAKFERTMVEDGERPVDLNSGTSRKDFDCSTVFIPPHIQELLDAETFPLSREKTDRYEDLLMAHYGIHNDPDNELPEECITIDDHFAATGKTYRYVPEYAACSSGFLYSRL